LEDADLSEVFNRLANFEVGLGGPEEEVFGELDADLSRSDEVLDSDVSLVTLVDLGGLASEVSVSTTESSGVPVADLTLDITVAISGSGLGSRAVSFDDGAFFLRDLFLMPSNELGAGFTKDFLSGTDFSLGGGTWALARFFQNSWKDDLVEVSD
jgi:hypothetical protein